MRVCVLVDNHFRGGVANVLSTLLKVDFDEPFEFTLVTNSNNPMLDSLIIGDMGLTKIIPFRFQSTSKWFAGTAPWCLRSGASFFLNILRKLFKPFLLVHQTFYFTRLFKNENFDALLNVNGGYPGSITSRGAALAWSRSRSLRRQVMVIHNFVTPSRVGFKLIDSCIDRLVFSSVDEVIAVSDACRSSFSSRSGLGSHRKLTVVHNGVKALLRENQRRDVKRKFLELNADQMLILMLGSYEPRKGHNFLLQSFAQFIKLSPSARLICAGDDPNLMIPSLKKQIARLGLEGSVTLLTFQSDTSELLNACDIVAIPSQSYESFCLVAVEAFRFARPIVGTNVGAIPEIAPHGFGAVLCDPDDVGSFSQALFLLSTDRAMYAEYSNWSGLRFELFGVERMKLGYRNALMGEL